MGCTRRLSPACQRARAASCCTVLAGCAGRLLIAIAVQTTAAAALSYYLLERPAQWLWPRRK